MFIAIKLAAVIMAAGLSSSAFSFVSFEGSTMGTSWQVKVAVLPSPLIKSTLKSDIDRILEQVNDQMSTWRKDSELSRFNLYRENSWLPVSRPVVMVVKQSLGVGKLTHGAFDTTVGNLVNLWGFGPQGRITQEPDHKALQSVLDARKNEKISYQLNPPALKKSHKNIYVDLSAIAKGYGVDQVANLLDRRGITSYMVEIGGEVSTAGQKPGAKPWVIAIEKPILYGRAVAELVSPRNAAMATSGDYRNYFEEGGIRYSHVIDPRTGRPIDHTTASVSIIADTCAEADALATAMLVLGSKQGIALAKKHDIAAYFVVREGKSFKGIYTKAFKGYLLQRK